MIKIGLMQLVKYVVVMYENAKNKVLHILSILRRLNKNLNKNLNNNLVKFRRILAIYG